MTLREFHPSRSFVTAPDHDGDAQSVPYAGQSRMRLTVSSGMANARLRIDPNATELLAIECGGGTPPRLRVSESELRVSWRFPDTIGSWLRSLVAERNDVELVLHPAVEWTLSIRGGLSRFEADLASGHLAGFEISGGVSDARIELPPPGAVVPIRVSGGASSLALRRPASAGVALAVSGGIRDLRLDEQSFAAIGGAARLESGPVEDDFPHYSVEINGGASGLYLV